MTIPANRIDIVCRSRAAPPMRDHFDSREAECMVCGPVRLRNGAHLRVFSISNWIELDVGQDGACEGLALSLINNAHEREIVRRGAVVVLVTPLWPMHESGMGEKVLMRFRPRGDMSCTFLARSDADGP